ncbi:hypothetical protein CES85_1985 [Ochrobactrum quorumnocens]|uniref:Uncharacterized protein n=1 Tax=Ochrobactrum quorumnocens TaxID=271865 RepID=A0A248UFJ4_9HYPH|nr:hypothetical protein CES85_1985 [[Ochrobactrum] quorumnocens]
MLASSCRSFSLDFELKRSGNLLVEQEAGKLEMREKRIETARVF